MSIWSDMQERGTGEAFKAEDVITKDNIEEKLRHGIIHFVYRKKPKKYQTVGDEREAWGTKVMTIVDHIPHGGDCPPKRAGYTIYFDLEKRGWRAFWDASLLKVEQRYYTPEDMERLFPDGEVFATGKFPDNSDV